VSVDVVNGHDCDAVRDDGHASGHVCPAIEHVSCK
jgi:hypothetical protein